MSPKVLLGVSVLLIAAFILANAVLLSRPSDLPKIQGVIIPQGQSIEDFLLVDHQNKPFTNKNLLGKWSLISYGFSDCPDICPTTLSKLAVVKKRLQALNKADDLQVLFYTVDPQRDTVKHLNDYIEFFDQDFIALTYGPELGTQHIPLQTSLGMVSALNPLSEEEAKFDYKGYSVSHGVVLYLVNPEGQLQAILKPKKDDLGLHYFEVEILLKDYLALSQHFS